MIQKNLESNIWKYTLFLIADKRIFLAILSVYYLTVPDVNAQKIGLLLLISTLAAFLFEIPSGYISDKLGHKQALVLSRALMLISTILFLITNSFPVLVAASVFLSISRAFYSGTGDAFMHETLRGLGRDKEYAKIMGKVSAIGFAIPVVFMVLTPFLVSVDYKLPFIISLITDGIGLAAALLFVVPKVSQQHVDEVRKTNFVQVIREGYYLHFFGLAALLGVVSGVLFGMGLFRAPYQVIIGVPVIYLGIFYGGGRIIASLLLTQSGKIKELTTARSFFGWSIIVYAILLFALGSSTISWVVVAVFLTINALQWGMNQVSKGYVLDVIGKSKFKATLLSVQSQFGLITGAVISFGLGFVIERIGYQNSYLMLTFFFVIITVPLYIYVARGVLKKVI